MSARQPQLAPIGELIERVTSWSPVRDAPEDELAYIDLSAVDNATKTVTGVQTLQGRDAPSRARQLVKSGDILVSTVRPNLNGVARVPQELDGATASTGFCVLRPRPVKLDGSYLFHWVRSPEFIADMVRKAIGASYPAVSDKIIGQSEIPLPPMEEQKRIAAILDQADELRRKRQRALERLNQLSQAIFIEMFGDPASNPMEWPMGTIRELLDEVKYGTSAKANTDGVGLPVLRMGNLTYDGKIDLSDLKYIELADDDFDKYTTCPGDILFNRTNSKEMVGKTAVVTQAEPLAIAGYLVRARTNDRGNPHYISAYLNSAHGKATLRNMCKNIVGMANINAQEFQNIVIAVPPKEMQDAYAARICSTEVARLSMAISQSRTEEMFVSLQHRAFRGEL